jgi:hypothetical protein
MRVTHSAILPALLLCVLGYAPCADAEPILVGTATPPPGGKSYGHLVDERTWVAIEFGLEKPVQITSVGEFVNGTTFPMSDGASIGNIFSSNARTSYRANWNEIRDDWTGSGYTIEWGNANAASVRGLFPPGPPFVPPGPPPGRPPGRHVPPVGVPEYGSTLTYLAMALSLVALSAWKWRT